MQKQTKPLLSNKDALGQLPGTGRGTLRKLIQSGWLTSCQPEGERPLYKAADLHKCLDRMANGETPKPIYEWKAALGQESCHLVLKHGNTPACTTTERNWTGPETPRKCTRCQHQAKALNVKD